jgi:hypothetical protein
MMDITFNIGSECNPRIVVYDSTGDTNVYVKSGVAGFAQICNDCGLSTFLVASKVTDAGISYSLVTDYALYGPSDLKILPTKDEFQQTELICNIHTVLGFDPRLEMEYFEWPCDSITWFVEDSDLELTYPVWNKTGVFMRLTAASEKGQKQIKWLLGNKQSELEKTLGDFRVEYDSESSFPREINTRVWDKPLTEFVFATDDEKYKLAEKVVEMNKSDHWFFQGLLEDCAIA